VWYHKEELKMLGSEKGEFICVWWVDRKKVGNGFRKKKENPIMAYYMRE
jgi:hypothetical protein